MEIISNSKQKLYLFQITINNFNFQTYRNFHIDNQTV